MMRVVAAGVLLAGVAGCAADRGPRAKSPELEAPAAPAQSTPAAMPSQAPAAPAAELPGSTEPAPHKQGMPEDKRAASGLLEQFEAAEVLALSSGRDCSTACRALRSMSHAAEQLCSLAQDDRERDRCTRARERVRAATQRVKDNCGQCAGGPALE